MCISPPELALPIRVMATKQYWIDGREKELRQQVLQELEHYQQLQRAWGLGSLKLKRRRGMLEIWADY